jgi:predicted TIM-barrel fold metal-dependent hydrolase
MFGSDYPFRAATEAVEGLADYKFDAADLRAIDRDNALKLMPQLPA